VRFTGKERDAETGLDYFGARYLSAGMGSFTSPDGAPLHLGHLVKLACKRAGISRSHFYEIKEAFGGS
jgi:RHS repeat-associated protein